MNLNKKGQYGTFDDKGNLKLNDDDIEIIGREFDQMYLNRISKSKDMKVFEDKKETHSHKPVIAKNSKKIADQVEKRILSEMGKTEEEKISKADILIFKGEKSKKQNENLKKELEKKAKAKCTFKPEISDYAKSQGSDLNVLAKKFGATIIPNKGEKKHRADLLFNIAKNSQILDKKKEKKSKNDLEFERYENYCTFNPVVHEVTNNAMV